MMLEVVLRGLLAALVLGLAARSILARDAMAATVAFVVYGLMVAVAWVALGAVDVALTEAAIGGGVTGALLLGAVRTVQNHGRARGRRREVGRMAKAMAALLSLGVSAALATAWFSLPLPAPTLATPAVESMPRLGLGNPVTAVLMAYRAWDTLLEKVVLGLALAGIWALAADGRWGGRPGHRPVVSENDPLRLLARVLPPLGVVVCVYLLWTGADLPGGAFQAGTILATMGILVVLAGLGDYPATARIGVRVAAMAGTALFLAIGTAGMALPGGFLSYPEPLAKPVIMLVEVGLVFSIGVTLCLLVAGPPRRKEDEP